MFFHALKKQIQVKMKDVFCGHDGATPNLLHLFVLKCWGPMDVHNCFAVSVGCGSKFRFDWLEQGQKQTTANNTNNTSSNKNNKSLASKCKVQYHATFFLCMSLVFSSTEMTTKLSSFLFVFQFEAEKLS